MRNSPSSGERQRDTLDNARRDASQQVIQFTLNIRTFLSRLGFTRSQSTHNPTCTGYGSSSSQKEDQLLDPPTECPKAKQLFWAWLTDEKIKEHQGTWVVFTKEGFLCSKTTNREARDCVRSNGLSTAECYFYKVDADYLHDIYSVFSERKRK